MCRLSASSIDQNEQSKGKETRHLFVYLLEDGSHSSGHIHVNLQERWCCRHQGNEPCSKRECPTKVPNGKTGTVMLSVTQHAVGIIVNKQVNGKILPIELMYVLNILCNPWVETASWSMWRKMIRKRRKPEKRVFRFHWSFSLLHPERHTLWEAMERNLSCWNPFAMNSKLRVYLQT